MYEEVFSGAFEKAEEVLEVLLTKLHDEIVLAKDIPVYSFCEHHMLPFFGKAHVAYIQKDNE